MNKRMWGSGPLCFIVGFILITTLYYLELIYKIPQIPISDSISNSIFIISIILTLIISILGFLSLPLKERGRKLVTNNAFKYIRHPIYAAFLDLFVFGLATYLKSPGIILAGIILIFFCGKLVENEEKFLIEQFGKKYQEYQKRTKKFIPCIY